MTYYKPCEEHQTGVPPLMCGGCALELHMFSTYLAKEYANGEKIMKKQRRMLQKGGNIEDHKSKKQVWQWRWFLPCNKYWSVDDFLMSEEEMKDWIVKNGLSKKRLKYEKHAGPWEVDV